MYMYILQLQWHSVTKLGEELDVAELPTKIQGRPYLFGEQIDAEVRTIISAMRERGAVVNSSITISIATVVVRKRNKNLLKKNGG